MKNVTRVNSRNITIIMNLLNPLYPVFWDEDTGKPINKIKVVGSKAQLVEFIIGMKKGTDLTRFNVSELKK